MVNSESKQIQGPAAVVLGFNKMMSDIGVKDPQFGIVTPDVPYLLPNTEIPVSNIAFIIGGAGMGDLICHFPAFIHMAKKDPWVRGTIVCPDYFRDFARNIMAPYKDTWTIHDSDTINPEPNTIVCAPGIKVNGVIRQPFCNGTAGHLVHASFINFVNRLTIPKDGDKYPVINFENEVMSEAVWDLHDRHKGKYIVFTPGGVSKARTVTGWLWSPLVYYVKRLGYLPVVLGKTQMSEHLEVAFPDGFPFDQTRNLIDQTTMIEAAFIMKNAAATIGLDNGLIQLASCTDASILAAYNIVDPVERVPNRWAGKFEALTLTRAELACIHCQTNLERIHPHSFTDCYYGTNACIDLLFRNNAEPWKLGLDRLLSSP